MICDEILHTEDEIQIGIYQKNCFFSSIIEFPFPDIYVLSLDNFKDDRGGTILAKIGKNATEREYKKNELFHLINNGRFKFKPLI